ncbi:MAG: methylmalonyl Co-A mutase-associated GTPase MeaB [Alphaproteobacteria bacterium]|nr:methylmalonyl Co-A mutase-associated GTPase MeaB [Alphaproteobacteria bacterium]
MAKRPVAKRPGAKRPGAERDVAKMAASVRDGDRKALARAITLIESTRADHRADADALLSALLPHSGKSVRIGISGAPGVGKSTFIEALGLHLTGSGHKVAVLAVDPSSKRSGGSILGDKTRMEELARDTAAFIRPSPAGKTLGGVARRTREAMLAAEAAGFDVIVVETVGVGQSETAVAEMTDMFVLLLSPGGGDELQGIKRGIVELADAILVNKADGEFMKAATQAAADYQSAVHMLRPASAAWVVPVRTCSALTGEGIAEAWAIVERYREVTAKTNAIAERRRTQAQAWMWSEIEDSLVMALRAHPKTRQRIAALEKQVAAGEVTPSQASRELIAAFRGGAGGKTP